MRSSDATSRQGEHNYITSSTTTDLLLSTLI